MITTLTTGGAERQVELLAAHSHHDVRVICLYRGGIVEDALRARGIPVRTLGMDGLQKATAVPRLARLLRREAPDVVHVHLLSAQLWGIPAARLARVPVVVSTEHSIMETTIEGRPKTPTLRRLYRVLEKMTTHTIAVSAATVARLSEWGIRDPSRLTVINPPIDFAALRLEGTRRGAVRAEFGIPDDAIVIGAVGRLDPVKRFDRLIPALADRVRGGAHLMIVGDGPLRPSLESAAHDLGIADRTHFTGPRPDVDGLLDAMDLLVSPSRDETFGMAVVEGLGAGLPVVFAQCPALDDVHVDADRFREIARDSAEATERADLDSAVADMIGQAVASGGKHAPTPAELEERYGARRTAAQVDALYERLVARRS